MTLVYRVENKHGEGMYTGRRSIHECPGFDHDVYNHPAPSSRMLSHSFSGYLFGFESLEAARKWLYEDEWLIWLDDQGYMISVYQINDDYQIYKENSQQLVFFNILESEGDCCIRSEPIQRLFLKDYIN